jgi:high-affinity Fe2+/Pb2+ permease
MAVPSIVIQTGTVAGAITALVVVGVLAGLVYRWHAESSSDAGSGAESEQEGAVGFPLASWRYVYDVEKADASREIAAVQQQAEELSEAERKSR